MTSDIHELDVVALLVDMPQEKLVRGQVGTVVMDYSPDDAEVEFSDQSGRTYALLAIPKTHLMRLYHEPRME
jgi:hypothetical protein